jgi:hypothetical protein
MSFKGKGTADSYSGCAEGPIVKYLPTHVPHVLPIVAHFDNIAMRVPHDRGHVGVGNMVLVCMSKTIVMAYLMQHPASNQNRNQ